MLHALKGFPFAEEAEECFSFEVEEVFFGDELAAGEVAAAHDVGHFFGDFHVVLADVTCGIHGVNAAVGEAKTGAAHDFDVFTHQRLGITFVGDAEHLRFGVFETAVEVHADDVLGLEDAEFLGFPSRCGHFCLRNREQTALQSVQFDVT